MFKPIRTIVETIVKLATFCIPTCSLRFGPLSRQRTKIQCRLFCLVEGSMLILGGEGGEGGGA